MKSTLAFCIISILFFSCTHDKLDKAQKETVRTSVYRMLHNYHTEMGEKGLMAEFEFLDNSDDFFWVPPGYRSALSYDSVKTIISANAKAFEKVEFEWDMLHIFPLSNTTASYTGIVDAHMTDTSGVRSPVTFIESGTLIKREDGWKLLNGQSAVLDSEEDKVGVNTDTNYGLHAKLKAKVGKGKELASVLLKASKLVSTAKGSILYMVSVDTTNEDSVWITEVWESKEDHDNSLKDKEVRILISEAMPLLDAAPKKGLELEVMGGI